MAVACVDLEKAYDKVCRERYDVLDEYIWSERKFNKGNSSIYTQGIWHVLELVESCQNDFQSARELGVTMVV